MAKQSNSLRSPEQLLSIKDELCLLIDACRDSSLDLPCHGIVETTRLLWAQFEELQMRAVREDAMSLIVNPTSYVPLQIETWDVYKEHVEAFDLRTVAIKYADTDRRVREKLAREGATAASISSSGNDASVSGRQNAVLRAAHNISRATAREIVNGTYGLANQGVESAFSENKNESESGPEERGEGPQEGDTRVSLARTLTMIINRLVYEVECRLR